MDTERRMHLLAIVENTRLAYKRWVEEGDSHLTPEDELYQRFQEIADQARVIDRRRAEPLELLFVGLAPHWAGFVSAQQTTADVTMLPAEELWQAWEQLAAFGMKARLPKLKHVEPIAELQKQGVFPRQICLIYGFLDDDGNPDLVKLQEAITEPGKHTGHGWVAPVNRHIAGQIEQQRVEAESLDRRRASKIAAATTPARESIETLVATGCSAVQIAKMKRISTDAVYDYCRQHGLPDPPYDYTGVLQAPGPHDPAITPERQHAMDTLGQDTSPQHPLRDRPDLGPAVHAGPEADADEAELPPDLAERLAALPEEEANQVQEAVTYFQQGMKPAEVAALMGNIHTNKVRALLMKAGVDPDRAPATA
jgi:hypothetical protein